MRRVERDVCYGWRAMLPPLLNSVMIQMYVLLDPNEWRVMFFTTIACKQCDNMQA